MARPGVTCGIVLAGGSSSRMGVPKASLPLLGRPLAAWVVGALRNVLDEVILVGGSPLLAQELGTGYAPDILPDGGPLAGICSALRATGGDVLVSACDTPLLRPELVEGILAAGAACDVAVPVNGGQYEPLIGLYRAGCLAAIEAALAAGKRQVRGIYTGVRVHAIAEPVWRQWDADGLSFVNVNSLADLDRARELMRRM